MSKCEEWWHESDRAEQTVCQLGSPWAIHLPTSSRDADCRSGEDWTGFPPLIAFCREWDKAMPSPSLNLSGKDLATAELLEGEITGHPWQLRQTTRDNTSRDKQHNSVNAEMSFHSVKKGKGETLASLSSQGYACYIKEKKGNQAFYFFCFILLVVNGEETNTLTTERAIKLK